ncbi:hypothetical protein LCGC14_0509300 [marine sediment metagenome]|uniref:S-adenosylmethionine decarboxylase proenzyme n=1 Tax=marine sediment metagenome TaxID=412755 RepID=A0A0F9S6D2_9ZZZZ|nr:adenosylmethionine decarboxylase [bacterium]
MSSIYRKFKCRVCKEKKRNPCDRDIGICQDCEDYRLEEDHPTKGTLLISEFWGCDFDILNNETILKKAAESAVSSAKCTLLKSFSHKFKPQGVSVLCFLEESHLALHTYPEYGYCSIIIYTCGHEANPKEALKIIKNIIKPKESFINEKIMGLKKREEDG